MTIPSLTHQPIVTQFEMARFVRLSNELDALKREQSELEQQLKAALQDGARVEAGEHTATLRSFEKRAVSWKDVVIRLKGAGYASNVLSHTKPKTYFKLVVG
ncbi:hypothetical protein MYX75_02795 [Acidobacteria bacterium AH-259-A15]|nr:hypothetical protein [Acidobacteria bacterium AH-259-A15]